MPKSKRQRFYSRHYRVTLGDVLTAHDFALKYGGLPGVRDITLVESAIARPYSGYHKSVHAKAAALTESLAKNHGFADGNKRTTLIVLAFFMVGSGYRFRPDTTNDDIETMIMDVVENRLSFPNLVVWFKARLMRGHY